MYIFIKCVLQAAETTKKVKSSSYYTLIPAFGRQSQANLCEFKASLICKVTTRTVRATVSYSETLSQKRKKKALKCL